MSMEPRIGPAGRDDETTRELRRMYAPRGGEAFWEGLERRILARVALAEEDVWWRQLARWRRGIAMAAVAAVLVAAFVARRADEQRSLAAYKAIEGTRIAALQATSETKT
ncbi:MAG: hypothetical protein ACRENC_18950, partial [Gemmatimonadaceae bacterium]